MSIPPVTMIGFLKNVVLCLFFISLSAMAAVSSEAAQRACSKSETTLPVPVPAKDKNSSGVGVIRTIRVALKPDREGISNANIYHGGAVVTAPVTTTGGLPSPPPPPPPPPPVISYAAMAS